MRFFAIASFEMKSEKILSIKIYGKNIFDDKESKNSFSYSNKLMLKSPRRKTVKRLYLDNIC